MPPGEAIANTLQDEAAQWLAAIVESSDDAIVGKSLEGRILSWNSGAERVYGYTAADVVGRSASILISPDRPDEENVILQEIKNGRRVQHYETVRIRKDGTPVSVSMTISPIRNKDGQVVGASAISRDISDRKRAETQLRASLNEKESLLKEIHHRVKNNLQVISSLLELQIAQIKDPSAIQLFRESQSRIRTMALIHEKLYQATDLARIDFVDYVQSLLRMIMRAQQSTQDVRLDVQCDRVYLGIDTAVPLGLIINELVSNSLKHAFPNGSGRPTITIALNQLQAERYCLLVEDNGKGFSPGFDVERSSSLGLRLVKILGEQLLGKAEWLPGEGARFKLEFSDLYER
ncbi:MAG TPA: PAS domain S-box protein [Methylomirabilota bacterium]|nr:PAS domain S-box protein [Methylomirabilota bacterium]